MILWLEMPLKRNQQQYTELSDNQRGCIDPMHMTLFLQMELKVVSEQRAISQSLWRSRWRVNHERVSTSHNMTSINFGTSSVVWSAERIRSIVSLREADWSNKGISLHLGRSDMVDGRCWQQWMTEGRVNHCGGPGWLKNTNED